MLDTPRLCDLGIIIDTLACFIAEKLKLYWNCFVYSSENISVAFVTCGHLEETDTLTSEHQVTNLKHKICGTHKNYVRNGYHLKSDRV